jgi:hypothetical protein
MALKVFFRSNVIWNSILTLMVSIVFLYLQYISTFKTKVFLQSSANSFLLDHFAFIVVTTLALLGLVFLKKIFTAVFFSLNIILVTVHTGIHLLDDLNKITLLLLFVYIVVSFFLVQFFILDQNESYLNSGVKGDELFSPMLKKVSASIYVDNKHSLSGYLTNWSEEGIFLYSENQVSISGKVNVQINYFDQIFEQAGTIVAQTRDKKGYGVRFEGLHLKKENSMGWLALFQIFKDTGFEPELLR